MASVLSACTLVLCFFVHPAFQQVTIYTENTTFWTHDSNLFSYTADTVRWLSGGGDPRTALNLVEERKELLSVTCHFAWRQILFSDSGTNTLFVYYPEYQQGVAAYLQVGTSPLVGHVTVDWLSNNAYWADAGFGWIGLQSLMKIPDALTFNDRLKVVVSTSLDKPYGVAVLPRIRRLFWTDAGSPPKLESADLLGDNRRRLIWQGLAKPTAITADVAAERLYWIDQWKETIESCDADGGNRGLVVYLKDSVLAGLTVFQDSLLFTTRDTGLVRAYNKQTGTETAESFSGGTNASGITVFASHTQPGNNTPCENAACNHICVHEDQPRCICSSGYTLAPGGSSCQESVASLWKSFLVGTSTQVCAVPLPLLFSHRYLRPSDIQTTIQCFLTDSHIRHIAVSSRNASVYYVSAMTVKVHHIHSDTMDVLYTGTNEIGGLVYDWRTSRVFWSERGTANRIVSLARGENQPRDLYTGLADPTSITVDSRRGDLYWFESQELYRGRVDGSQSKETLLSSDFNQIHRLVFSQQEDRVYWLDENHVGSATRNGTERKRFGVSSVLDNNGLATYRGYLVWSTGGSSAKLTFRDIDLTLTDPPVTFTLPGLANLIDLSVYDPSENSDDHCELDNGGCSQLCLNLGDSHQCACKFGFKLQDDNKTCVTETLQENFFLVTDRLSSEIYQVDGADRAVVKRSVAEERAVWAAVYQDSGRAEHVTYDEVSRDILWYDADNRAIKRWRLGGSSVTLLRKFTDAHVTALCVDTSAKTVYYVLGNDAGWTTRLQVMLMEDPNIVKTLYTGSSDPPTLLAISPATGRLAYGKESGKVMLADMTLHNELQVTSQVAKTLSGLTFAYDGTLVVWSDSGTDQLVEYVVSTGSRRTRLDQGGHHPHNVVAFGTDLYFLTRSARTIRKLSSNNKDEVMASFLEFGELTSLHFQGPEDAAPVNTSCSVANGRCSTLCIPTPSGRQCMCQDGVSLDEDQRTCKDVERCPDNVPNGQLSSVCDRHPGKQCTYTCNDGYEASSGVSSITCQTSGGWDVVVDTLCLKAPVPPEPDDFPTYAVVIVAVVVVCVAVLTVGCFLYRRMKKFGGRDSSRTGFDNAPVVFVTDTSTVCINGINGPAKCVDDDDNASATYDELEPIPDEVRYQSFSKISPRPGRQRTTVRPPEACGGPLYEPAKHMYLTPHEKPYSSLQRPVQEEDDEEIGSYVEPQSFFIKPSHQQEPHSTAAPSAPDRGDGYLTPNPPIRRADRLQQQQQQQQRQQQPPPCYYTPEPDYLHFN